jgi:hypothetical protein
LEPKGIGVSHDHKHDKECVNRGELLSTAMIMEKRGQPTPIVGRDNGVCENGQIIYLISLF